jgi:ABC-type multidrug transport system fused ATPase/permease subunit
MSSSIAGGRNVLDDSPVAYPQISLEGLMRLDPDVVVDMGDMTATQGVTGEHKRPCCNGEPEGDSRRAPAQGVCGGGGYFCRSGTARNGGRGSLCRHAQRETGEMNLLTLSEVSFHYPEAPAVLEGITAHAAGPQLIAVMGPNGAGKSTLLDVIAGLKAPASGVCLVEGRARPRAIVSRSVAPCAADRRGPSRWKRC